MNATELREKVHSCRERSFSADETLRQLRAPNPYIMGSWRACHFARVPSEDYPEEDAGLLFEVNGFLFKGSVLITLAWDDTYKVRFFRKRVKENGVIHLVEESEMEQHNVYFDELTDRIDKLVETKE